MRHPRPESIRLGRWYQAVVYGVLLVLFLSGVAWAGFQYLVGTGPASFQSAKSWSLKVHGAASMATLLVVGSLLTAHVRFAWRANRNRLNGAFFIATLTFLTATGYGLYYLGDERWRAFASWSHLAVGVLLPFLVLTHVVSGRRTRLHKSAAREELNSRGSAPLTKTIS
jgi:hypothetical protein